MREVRIPGRERRDENAEKAGRWQKNCVLNADSEEMAVLPWLHTCQRRAAGVGKCNQEGDDIFHFFVCQV